MSQGCWKRRRGSRYGGDRCCGSELVSSLCVAGDGDVASRVVGPCLDRPVVAGVGVERACVLGGNVEGVKVDGARFIVARVEVAGVAGVGVQVANVLVDVVVGDRVVGAPCCWSSR